MQKVDKHTRAGRNGKNIFCPHCKNQRTVYHFAWSALLCGPCNKGVNKTEWLRNG